MLMLTVHAIIFLLVITLKTHRTLDLDPEMQLMEGSSWRDDFVFVSVHCVPTNLSLSSRLCLFLVAVLRLYPSSVHYVHTAVEQL